MLTARSAASTACVLVTCAVCASACGPPATQQAGEAPTTAPYVVADDAVVVPVTFADITTEHCLAGYLLDDGAVQTTSCTTPGSSTVVAVTTFGPRAPTGAPDPIEITAAAQEACAPATRSWLDEQDLPDGVPEIHVFPEAWSGPSTALVCAVWTGP